ncbi:hypothetical protein Ahy_A03g016262 isoform A [Arachis hypogaea]|uniref:Uncharacterized protein n=1 Tax=Arachis hypogaea TaxID=3818 RepID=A0A445E2R8_ARAHY|nr:hypothetical protein Ahy_A03g016262 isoform A [Arachis hypogaea]
MASVKRVPYPKSLVLCHFLLFFLILCTWELSSSHVYSDVRPNSDGNNKRKDKWIGNFDRLRCRHRPCGDVAFRRFILFWGQEWFKLQSIYDNKSTKATSCAKCLHSTETLQLVGEKETILQAVNFFKF